MKLILSKIIRKYRKELLPYTCYADQHLPQSLNVECDCVKFCKFTPRGNLWLQTLQYNQIPSPYLKIRNLKQKDLNPISIILSV